MPYGGSKLIIGEKVSRMIRSSTHGEGESQLCPRGSPGFQGSERRGVRSRQPPRVIDPGKKKNKTLTGGNQVRSSRSAETALARTDSENAKETTDRTD